MSTVRRALGAVLLAGGGLASACGGTEEASPGSDIPDATPASSTLPDAPSAPPDSAGLDDAAIVQDAHTSEGDAARPSTGYDVFLLAGQSNMVGRGQPFDAILDEPDPAIFQWGRGGDRESRIVPAAARLDHADGALLDRVGMGLSFAKAYRAAQTVARPILLVPTAKGGSSFSAHQWNPGDPLLEDAVSRTNAALATDPGNRLIGILWHQGENDVGQLDTAGYAAAIDGLIGSLRARVQGATNTPVVLGRFCPAWNPAPSDAAPVLAAIDATPNRVSFTAVAPATGLGCNPGDEVHFDAPGLRAYGVRYFEALATARATPR